MKGADMIFVIILVALIVFTGFQSMEISALKDSGVSITGEATGKAIAKAPEKSSSAGSYKLPENLENLKTMVGGC